MPQLLNDLALHLEGRGMVVAWHEIAQRGMRRDGVGRPVCAVLGGLWKHSCEAAPSPASGEESVWIQAEFHPNKSCLRRGGVINLVLRGNGVEMTFPLVHKRRPEEVPLCCAWPP